MPTMTAAAAGRHPVRRPVAPLSPADRLDELADRLARLGHGARDAEVYVVEKWSLVAEVRALAREARR